MIQGSPPAGAGPSCGSGVERFRPSPSVNRPRGPFLSFALPLALASLLAAPPGGALTGHSAAAQESASADSGDPAGTVDGYLDHDALTEALEDLESAHGDVVTLESFARTHADRDVWKLTLGSPQGRDLDERPALLIVANLEGNRLAGSTVAVRMVEELAAGYGQDDAVTELLDERTVYVLPRMNPDGAELAWSMPGYELPYKPHPDAPDDGGLNVRERGEDLSGNGLVQLMRVEDPDGTLIADPDEPRLLREADAARAERGEYRVYVEGIDPEDADAYVPMGSDGVNLNRNFPHEYLYYQPHVGPHQVSEPETRALADFMYEQVNIAAVFTFSAYDNLRSVTAPDRTPPEDVAPGPPNIPENLHSDDRPYYEFISERFEEVTGLTGDGEPDEGGSFSQFAYYQVGIPSFTTPVWTVPPTAEQGGEASAGEGAALPVATGGSGSVVGGGAIDEQAAQWLAHFDDNGLDGFVEWEEAEHPDLGTVEVGGFRPNARVNPPAEEAEALAADFADFAVWLGGQLPEVSLEEPVIEPRGDHVYEVTATVVNDEYLPTHLDMGVDVRTNRPVTARLMPTDGVTVLSGDPQQQIDRLGGMGDRHTFTWLVQGRPGTEIPMELFAERAGGLQSTTLTLP